ncbi:MAG: ThiF family adenylyltransferase [Candidatus Berkiella sp.]
MRYQRQVLLPQVGKQGQQALEQSKVLCVGAGGLGSSALLYLAAAGIGHLGIMDHDKVAITNLHRQILYKESDIGKYKAIAAKENLQTLNHTVSYEAIPLALCVSNALEQVSQYDYILDATDNIKSKLLLNDICHYAKKPLVSAQVEGFKGHLMVFCSPKTGCLRCLYPTLNADLALPTCENAGVLGVVPGLLGMLQALEVKKLILGITDNLLGMLYEVDMLKNVSITYPLPFAQDCVLCTKGQDFVTLSPNQIRGKPMHPHQISANELMDVLKNPESVFLLDVRNPDEHAAFNIGGNLIPLDQLPHSLDQLPKNKPIIIYCRSGHRSQLALEFLQQHGFSDVKNLMGGVLAWPA